MNKIKELIDRQLGQMFMVPRSVLKQEQEKRELLEGIIEQIIFLMNHWLKIYDNGNLIKNIALIEKHLKMKWKDIIDFLED